jgi:hypothetical protein
MSNEEKALMLLRKILDRGHRQESMITDTTWSVPIELIWEIERFLEEEKNV